ncbi:MAG: hypothetical protein AAB404_01145 [Patescibacteria group bacterium]
MIIWIVLAIAVILILITIIANSTPSYDEKKEEDDETKSAKTPDASKAKKNYLWPIIAVILLGILVWAVIFALSGAAKKQAAPVRQVAMEFHLKVGEETPTVEVGFETRHLLWANKPYQAVSVQKDGSRIIYPMPAGPETWNGDEPGGRLRLIGKEEDTVIKIVEVK